jgi:AcrR family transcriptional regulator
MSPRAAPVSKPAPGPVTPKGVATRAFILQTAAEVFAERGYSDTTLSELIARSGMAKGAFYFHFASKEQLALAVLEEKQSQWLEFVRERALAQPTAIEQLRAFAPALVQLHRSDPSAFSAARLSRDLRRMPELAEQVRAHTRAWIELVADIVARAQEQRALPQQLDAQELAAVLVAATDGLKDLSDILDPPAKARRGFERRMGGLVELLEAIITAHQL